MKTISRFLAVSAIAFTAIVSSFNLSASDIDSRSLSGHSVYGSIGIGHIISSVDFGWESGDARIGLDWQVGYEWMSDKKIGAGFLYSGYRSGGKSTVGYNRNSAVVAKGAFYINYLAPQFVGYVRLGNPRWTFNYTVGLGLAICTETASCKDAGVKVSASASKCGFGMNIGGGFQYALNNNWRLLMNLSWQDAIINQDTDEDRDENTGFARLGLNFGVKYSF